MTTNGSPRRKRPHPARRARRITGYASAAGMLMLTGCMAAAAKTSTATPSAAGNAQPASAAQPFAGQSDDGSYAGSYNSDDGGSAAVPAAPNYSTAQPITASHGS